jgi:hypothetical protein
LLDDFTQLLVSSGAVDALASLFALCDRPKEQSVEPVPPAILAGLRLLESLIESGGSFPEGGVSEGQGSLIVALRATALAGLPSLLTSVLLQTENETRAPVLADPILAASRPPRELRPGGDGDDASVEQHPRRVRPEGSAKCFELIRS